MVKGHNKGNPISKTGQKGGDEHEKGKKKQQIHSEKKGRNAENEKSGGSKGKNSI
jgi:hypothetical protein